MPVTPATRIEFVGLGKLFILTIFSRIICLYWFGCGRFVVEYYGLSPEISLIN